MVRGLGVFQKWFEGFEDQFTAKAMLVSISETIG